MDAAPTDTLPDDTFADTMPTDDVDEEETTDIPTDESSLTVEPETYESTDETDAETDAEPVVPSSKNDKKTKEVDSGESGETSTLKPLGFTQFIADHPAVLGVLFLIMGPIIALFGKRWFPNVVASIVFIFVSCGFMIMFSALECMETTPGLAGSIAGSLVLGILFAWFAKAHIWAAIGLLGLIGGWFLGEMIYLCILGVSDWQNLPGYLGISGGCVLIVGFCSFKYS